MWEDPIVKESRAPGEELFNRFGGDFAAVCEFLREREREHPERLVTLEPKPVNPRLMPRTANVS